MSKLTLKANLILVLIVILSCFSCKEESKEKEENKETNFLFNKLSVERTNISFQNTITEDVNHSIINYIYYYNGGGVAAGDINNDGLPDLYFVSNMGENKLYLNKGNMEFEDITATANVSSKSSWNTGVTMVDINNDGFLDIYLCSVSGLLDFEGHNELFINNGDGTFTEMSKEYGLDFKGYSTQAYFFDYDKDGDLDVYIVNHAVHTTLSHGPSHVRNQRVPLVGDVLLNNDNGKFVDVSAKANIYGGINGYGLSATIADFNNDGWDDIYVCNDFHEDDYYYINNQDGTFSDQIKNAFSTISRFSMGSDAADINGNGYQDLITLDMLPKDERIIKETEGDDAMFNMQERMRELGYKDQYARNMLQINNNGAYFTETALYNNIADTDWSWGPLIADFNNDGHQDLFVSNGILRRPNSLDFRKYVANAFRGRSPESALNWLYNSINEMPSGRVTNEIFEGNSNKFENRTGEWIENMPSLSNGAIYIDLDNDGDLDLVINNLNGYANVYENTTNSAKNYLSVQLDYKDQNKEGIGAKVIVFSGGKSQLKQLFKSRGFLSATDSTLHFGLGDDNKIDSLQVIWPNQKFQILKDPKINQRIIVSYAEDSIEDYKYQNKLINEDYFKESKLISFEHIEDDYNDFVQEKLIPYKVSTLGPAIDIADIDNNGFDDIFIGNSSGKPAKLYLNNGISFREMNIEAIENDSLYEDNDAVFFDANNNNSLDLYVASGINRTRDRAYEADRLYLNINGSFVKSEGKIPINSLVTSCVAAYDFDNDGDMDLFVGNLSDPDDFGLPVSSYILVNDGQGTFHKHKGFSLTSKVTSAVWADIDNDGVKDLLVSTEWDGPKIYLNKNGKLTLVELPEGMNGLWQSIASYDIDGDGDQDILLGNWGLNTRFNPTAETPLLMYYSDFDQNGKNETVLAYGKNGNYYPVNSKDELASQMNVISKRFVTYKDFALKTIEEVLTTEAVNKAVKYEVHTFASGYLRNDNGSFHEFVEFPKELQLGPINSFKNITIDDAEQLLVSGNTLKVNTYHSTYTSLKGLFLKDLSDMNAVSEFGIQPFHGQVKETVTLKMKDKNLLIIITNNEGLKAYTYKK
ncbi:VCBS repeat-containing protein [Gelidibacter pelagius]|uniref:VCBS repeat-containing protein n=1 Tax=Gelidibacter pelagius TaxID=2819985 RepID=A0ABS3SWN8_9FLAO|nr:VCBS repeat-containing protein [Gelidibacter pelagius]MBO3100128.1 VCBS repeat-containing protein [Gelidibacter pelagius]